jgi:putative membrane protein
MVVHSPSEENRMPTRLILRTAVAAVLASFAFTAMAQSTRGEPHLVANAADSMFMTHAAADGMAEVQMGQMALQKTSDPKVKQLAQRIVEDHTAANGKLRALAQQKQVTLPSAPMKDAQDKAATMNSMDGAKFDQAWAAAMVDDHQKAVKMFSNETTQTQDADVRTFAQATLPTLKTHLEMAQQLQNQTK